MTTWAIRLVKFKTAEVSAEVLRQVDGAATHVLEQVGREARLALLIGYAIDAQLMPGKVLHDCHCGNLFIDQVSQATPILKWHNFARDLWTSDPRAS